jgi:hypothetical protein
LLVFWLGAACRSIAQEDNPGRKTIPAARNRRTTGFFSPFIPLAFEASRFIPSEQIFSLVLERPDTVPCPRILLPWYLLSVKNHRQLEPLTVHFGHNQVTTDFARPSSQRQRSVTTSPSGTPSRPMTTEFWISSIVMCRLAGSRSPATTKLAAKRRIAAD